MSEPANAPPKQRRHGRGKQRAAARQPQLPPELPEDALCLQLLIPAGAALEPPCLADCPVPIEPRKQQQQQGGGDDPQHAGDEQQRQQVPGGDDGQCYTLQLPCWSLMPQVVGWCADSLLPTHPAARLAFAPSLPKDQRADVHTCVSKRHAKTCASLSEGFGERRCVAVVAKGAVKPAARRMTGEQADHALALWLLWKQQQKQQQQQQPEGLEAGGGGDAAAVEGVASGDAAAAAAAAAARAARVYSRDEVAQMLAADALTDELAALWVGPQGAEQRAVRELCLAAAAGDEEELRALLLQAEPPDGVWPEGGDPSPHAAALARGTGDLSSGGGLPLHLAASGGQVGALACLLAAGAPLEATDGRGHTALQVAQRSEQCDCEALLLQAGARDTQQDAWQQQLEQPPQPPPQQQEMELPGGFL